MPRENINLHDESTDFRAAVGWSREIPVVQVGVTIDATPGVGDEVETAPPPTVLERLYGGNVDALIAVGAAMVKWAAENPIEDADETLGDEVALEEIGASVIHALDDTRTLAGNDGLWATLDRAAVNRMIRALRKARDQAFGADE